MKCQYNALETWEEVQAMDEWKATDIAVLLRNSLDIIRHRGRFVRYVIYCVSCTIVILWALSEMPTAADKANFGYILLVFWLWCLPFLIYFYKKAFVYDKNPMAYVLTEVILKESHERNPFLKFFTLRFQDENGHAYVADTGAIFSTNGIAKPQFKDCTGRKARIAYHKGIQKVYVLEIL